MPYQYQKKIVESSPPWKNTEMKICLQSKESKENVESVMGLLLGAGTKREKDIATIFRQTRMKSTYIYFITPFSSFYCIILHTRVDLVFYWILSSRTCVNILIYILYLWKKFNASPQNYEGEHWVTLHGPIIPSSMVQKTILYKAQVYFSEVLLDFIRAIWFIRLWVRGRGECY